MEASVRTKVLVDVLLPGIGAPTRINRLALDTVLVLGFALFTTIFAQIAIRIPTTTVPITAATFGVLLTGAALGSKRGGLSIAIYMLMGMAGFTVFAPPSSYMADKTFHFILPWAGKSGAVWDIANGGYIVGFILAAYLVGLLAEKGWDRRPSVPIAMILGNVCVYLIGLPWLALFIASEKIVPGLSITYYDAIVGNNVLDKTLKGGLYPFIGGDSIKLLLATIVLPGAWTIVNVLKGTSQRRRRPSLP